MNANERPNKDAVSNASLRDTFAAAALQGLIASNFYDRYKAFWKHEVEDVGEVIPDVAATIAYEYAEAMLARREVSTP